MPTPTRIATILDRPYLGDMHTLRMLGGIGLSGPDGGEVDALLRQPKHLALLAYLALPRPGSWHRRDSMLGTFWPEHDQARARASLRSAIFTLRRLLPKGAIISRGGDDLSLDAASITSDVAALSEDLMAGRYHEALACYKGELLPGMFVNDAPGFQEWLEHERRRVQGLAQKAAAQLADRMTREGNLTAAIAALRRGTELAPDDELTARQLILLLDRVGDRAQAFAVYERFRTHVSNEFGVRPSAETVALMDSVRTRREARPATSSVLYAPTSTTSVAASPPTGTESPSDAVVRASAPDPRAPIGAAAVSVHPVRTRWLLAATMIVTIAVGWVGARAKGLASAATTTRSLVVLPMVNETGDPALAYIASGIADGVARRLEGIGGIIIRSGARSDWPDSTRNDMRTIGREFGSTVLVKSHIRRIGDSLEVSASVVDASTLEERAVAARRFPTTRIQDAESRLAADVAGAVFRTPLPAVKSSADRRVNDESYRLMLEGWHRLQSNPNSPERLGQPERHGIARTFFARAVEIDPLNARAWSGLSSVWGALAAVDDVPFDDGYERSSAAAMQALSLDSLQGMAWANLAIMRALKYRDLSVGLPLLRRAEMVEPSNPGIFRIRSSLLRHAHLFDQARDADRVARSLDPLSSVFIDHEASTELCANRPNAALSLYASELAMSPTDRLALTGMTRTLAMLGRYDDAIIWWRRYALTTGDTALSRGLATATGRDGYWRMQHAKGRQRLAVLKRRGGQALPFRLMQAHFASGDADAGFIALNTALAAGTRALYRLPCMPDLDEFRDTPRYAGALARIGTIRVR